MISECTLCHSLPHVILMGKRGTSPACLSVSVCVNMLIRNFLPYLAWGFYSCHTLCFWGGAGLVPKHSISCSSVSSDSWKWSSYLCSASVKCLFQTSPTRHHTLCTTNSALCLYSSSELWLISLKIFCGLVFENVSFPLGTASYQDYLFVSKVIFFF